MARSLNKVTLIGNLTRDPELRYTPSGAAVCTFGLATNRSWSAEGGEKKEDVEFHRIVSWQKLAELCSQLLSKGRKVYVEGRLQTRRWTGKDEVERQTTEIVIHEMLILDSKFSGGDGSSSGGSGGYNVPEEDFPVDFDDTKSGDSGKKKKAKSTKDDKKSSSPKKKATSKKKKDDEEDDDIPF